MNTNIKTIWVVILVILTSMLTVPAFAHGADLEQRAGSTEIFEDKFKDGNSDFRHDEGDSSGNTLAVIGAIVGAVLLSAGVAFLFVPRPSLPILIGLALIGATGVIHLIVGGTWGNNWLMLNGIGYIGLGIAWAYPYSFIPHQKRIIAIALAIYTLVTIAGYFLTHDHYDLTGVLAKIIEVPLLLLLAYYAFSGEQTAPTVA